ncbi:hypothetical protein HW090_05410 [Pseudomonas sp. ABC1]|uniref:hypothetical protein n=1 Tax=Pseudomonas sp. ABC1 TaxID=2748080 RepID=UPI0015C38926|nr:hypothetical protein [Pseudomonas sp. ABC1]QLF92658.1 hypothetical protein HW090_05410 [Pseudomonas sp. ABC1]
MEQENWIGLAFPGLTCLGWLRPMDTGPIYTRQHGQESLEALRRSLDTAHANAVPPSAS